MSEKSDYPTSPPDRAELVLAPPPAPAPLRQADSDAHLVSLWLHGRSPHTQRAYLATVRRFAAHVGKPLAHVTLGDLQSYEDTLVHLALRTRARHLAAVKSLLTFGQKIGYLPYNVGAAKDLPRAKGTLAGRILTEREVQRILALETDPRNRMVLELLYASGARVSELVRLTWRDVAERDEGRVQLTLFGKGAKTRYVLLPPHTSSDLLSLRNGAATGDPLFPSRRGGPLGDRQIERIVREAAQRAGIEAAVSPHWLRHSHATHALERGCPIHLVQATLGHASVATTGLYLHARPTESSGSYLPL